MAKVLGKTGRYTSEESVKRFGKTIVFALVLLQLNIPKIIKEAIVASTVFITPGKITIDSTSSILMGSIITVL